MRQDFAAPAPSYIHNDSDPDKIAQQYADEEVRDTIFKMLVDRKRPIVITDVPYHPNVACRVVKKYPRTFKVALRYKRGKTSNEITVVTLGKLDTPYIEGWSNILEPFGPILYGE